MAQLTEQQKAEIQKIVRDELMSFILNDRYVFQKHMQLFDGRNIQVGKGTGTKIGTESTQKLGFYGATPIIRGSTTVAYASTVSDNTETTNNTTINSNFSNLTTAINSIRTALANIGITS